METTFWGEIVCNQSQDDVIWLEKYFVLLAISMSAGAPTSAVFDHQYQ